MRTMGIAPGDAVLVIEHRGEQQIVYNALVAGITMRESLRGPKGEMAIEATFVAAGDDEVRMQGMQTRRPVVTVPNVVHISHSDWIDGRAELGYEELPGPPQGVCRYCHCTEQRACPGGCAWLDVHKTVCSAEACAEQYVEDNLRRRPVERAQ